MSIRTTEALVLSVQDYRETSKIVRLYTRTYGPVSLVAKGIRKTAARYGDVLNALNLVRVIYYHKDGRSLHTFSQADLLEAFPGIHANYEKLQTSLAMAEVVKRNTLEGEENAELYDLIAAMLKRLQAADENPLTVYLAFLIRLLSLMGFALNLSRCIQCDHSLTDDRMLISLRRGGVFCRRCGSDQLGEFFLSRDAVGYLLIQSGSGAHMPALDTLTPADIHELMQGLHRWFRHHIESFRVPIALQLLKPI